MSGVGPTVGMTETRQEALIQTMAAEMDQLHYGVSCGGSGEDVDPHDVARSILTSPAMVEHVQRAKAEVLRQVADEISAAHGPGSSGWVNMLRARADREEAGA